MPTTLPESYPTAPHRQRRLLTAERQSHSRRYAHAESQRDMALARMAEIYDRMLEIDDELADLGRDGGQT